MHAKLLKRTWQICISRICLYIALLCRPAMSSTQDVYSVVQKNSCETVFFAPIFGVSKFFSQQVLGRFDANRIKSPFVDPDT